MHSFCRAAAALECGSDPAPGSYAPLGVQDSNMLPEIGPSHVGIGMKGLLFFVGSGVLLAGPGHSEGLTAASQI